MAGVVHIPWYGTFFRGDKLAAEVREVAAASLRYGATQYQVHRSRDDAYRILQQVWFESRSDWERYWDGPEMIAFRTRCAGWYQVPVLYAWNDEIAVDRVTIGEPEPAAEPASTPAA
jgi:quinol monooxygenase YgiN